MHGPLLGYVYSITLHEFLHCTDEEAISCTAKSTASGELTVTGSSVLCILTAHSTM